MLWPSARGLSAQDKNPSTVLVVRVPGDDGIVVRLRAELNSYRFRVVELPPAKRAESLAQLAEEREAQAALRAKPEAMAVEVWVSPSAGAGRTNEELVNAGPGRDASVLAVRVTEAMRARGLALPPLAASAADSGRREPAPKSAADDVEPARPTVAPPNAVPASPPAGSPKAAESASDAERNAEAKRKAEAEDAEAERRADAERKLDAERKAELARKADAQRQDSERQTAEARREAEARKLDAARKAELARRAEAQRQDSERESSDSEAEAQRKAETQRSRESDSGTPTSASSATPIRARNALLYAEVGPSGVWSPGTNRLGPALDVFVSVKFRPYHSSSISLVGLIPLLSTDFTNSDGTAIEVQTFGIGGFGDLHLPLGPVELNVGIGGMAMLSSILLVENPSLFNTNIESQRLAALLGRVGACITLTPDLRLSASLMVGLTVKDLRLQLFDASGTPLSPEVRWGQPLLFGTLGLELALPWDR